MKNYFEYEEYIGTISLSAEDKVFYGVIHGITDVVTFEGTTVEELETSFHEAVDDYLETCRLLNKSPDKTYKGSFNVRLPKELHHQTSMLAIKIGLNMNEVIKRALKYVTKNEQVLKA